MATTAVDRVFVDTNVLVYSTVVTAPLHAVAAQATRRPLVRRRRTAVEPPNLEGIPGHAHPAADVYASPATCGGAGR